MFCPCCGAPIADGARFCPVCGNTMNAAPAAEPQHAHFAPSTASAAPVQPAAHGQHGASVQGAAPGQHAATAKHAAPGVAVPARQTVRAAAVSAPQATPANVAPVSQAAPFGQAQPAPVQAQSMAYAAQPSYTADAPAAPVQSRRRISAKRIIPCVVAVLALVLSCMPWLEIDQSAVRASTGVSNIANSLSALVGQDNDYSSSLQFDDSYNVWGLGDAGKVFISYQEAADQASSTLSDLNDALSESGHGRVVPITNPNAGKSSSEGIAFFSTIITGIWGVGLVATIVGAVSYLLKGIKPILVIGCVFLTVSGGAFAALFAPAIGSFGSATMFPALMVAATIVTLVLTLVLREGGTASAAANPAAYSAHIQQM